MSLMEKFKWAGKVMVDGGAKTMLKTDLLFLEREIKSRKQRFGVEVYELMEALEVDSDLSIDEKEGRIRLAFDRARKDIAVIQAKIDCKKEEIVALEIEASADSTSIPQHTMAPANNNHIIMSSHPGDSTEMEHGFPK
mmetsp:Transcript_31670/g.46706  ORF Transcript_31670/g.46706 Transcript_31670/m.46706 type:complete len:138 (+) Transcript_31670:111-524(+)|eukprot:CAMPEP_0195507734 /NCGR_PEP_ID=MMETSP0794_2-20130614/1125_1 /TAXON_ID=515487 /ORGANISM="Stephanopyxis turris, Strain CCMP 815" /LENGTH=137 /DNA_ID=CAMNT_0040634515 /DNA_START=101 /DNA_END=514 /DNA_ORIENTATION=+